MIDELASLRTKIDKADRALMAALAERMELIRKIGELKRAEGIPARDDARWKEVVTHAMNEAEGNGVPATLVEDIFAAIHRAALEIETKGA